MNNVGESIKKMRLRKGLSQWSLAKALGRSQAFVSEIECGYRTPSDELLQKIMAAISLLRNRNQSQGE